MGSRVVGWPGRQIGSGCVKWVGWCVDKWVDGRMGGCVGGRGVVDILRYVTVCLSPLVMCQRTSVGSNSAGRFCFG